jgi:glutathione S-transferase
VKLYYAPGACSLADHIALVEGGLRFDLEKVDLKARRTESGGDYLAVNPKGYVPALALDDGEVLTENVAVLLYIADTSGKLIPRSGIAHWRAIEALAYISSELHKNFKPFFSPDSDEAAKRAARELLGKRFALLGDQLDDRDFLVGDEISVADCYLFVMLGWARERAGIDLPANLAAYHDRMKRRPAVAKAMAAEGLG